MASTQHTHTHTHAHTHTRTHTHTHIWKMGTSTKNFFHSWMYTHPATILIKHAHLHVQYCTPSISTGLTSAGTPFLLLHTPKDVRSPLPQRAGANLPHEAWQPPGEPIQGCKQRDLVHPHPLLSPHDPTLWACGPCWKRNSTSVLQMPQDSNLDLPTRKPNKYHIAGWFRTAKSLCFNRKSRLRQFYFRSDVQGANHAHPNTPTSCI